jgi:hypothetical protein
MSEFLNDLISLALAWIFIGSAIWAYCDPVRYADFVTRRYVERYGRLPGEGVLLLSVVVAIVKWPLMARVLWRRA